MRRKYPAFGAIAPCHVSNFDRLAVDRPDSAADGVQDDCEINILNARLRAYDPLGGHPPGLPTSVSW